MPNIFPLNGDNPAVNRGAQSDYKRLFFSKSEACLMLNKGLHSGFGVLNEGTVLSKSTVDGLLVPYPKTLWVAGTPESSFAFLVVDQVNGESTCTVALGDAYKFKVGDSLVLRNNPASPVYHDGGLITAISYGVSTATITFTTATAVATFTTARASNAYIKSKATSPFKAAYGILGNSVDTGYGPSSGVGAGAGVIMSHAILYVGALESYDTDAVTDLSAVVDGQFFILK